MWYDKINRNDSDKTGTSPSKKQLQDILYKANKGDKNALLKLIKAWNHKAGIGTNARTPEEIAAGNKRVVDNLIKGGKDFAGEILSIYDIQRLFTGKDPITGKDANRGVAGFWLAVDVVTVLLPFTKLGKIGKGAKAADVVDDASDAAKGAKVVDKVDDVGDGAKVVRNRGNNISNPLENIQYTDKVKKQMKQGDFHSFPEAVDSFGSDGKITQIIGGDGIPRTKVEIQGSYKGKEGVFEYIIEPDNTVNHRFFRPIK